MNNDKTLFGEYLRPKLAELLKSLALDYTYTKAEGDYLYYKNGEGKEVAVLDFVGGFGTTILGHNNPELKAAMIAALEKNIPFAAQSAIRLEAAKLAEKLNMALAVKTKYLVNFSNSGAESVEAAIKHAYKVRFDVIRREHERISRVLNDLYHKAENENMELLLPAGKKDLADFRDGLDEYNLTEFEKFHNGPVVAALKGSFHGKTTSALKATFNKTYREGFEGLSALKPVFINPAEPERLKEAVEENYIEFLEPVIEAGEIVLKSKRMSTVIAFIMEVILGEGGIKIIPDNFLEGFAGLHAELGVPYIIDEIQTGMGRTGSVFAFKNTGLKAIEPEYITLSKALGGGLVKIGATMINEKVYDRDFGVLHTSTFCEDELSCSVAGNVVDILLQDNGKIMKEAEEKGAYLMKELGKLKKKYPWIINDVRGKGLMIGIEFGNLKSKSMFFRYAGRQGFLSLLVASYLLKYYAMRTLAPLSTMMKGNPGRERLSVLRIQPSAFITKDDMDRLISALDEVYNVINANNEYCLIAHLIGEEVSQQERKKPKTIQTETHEKMEKPDFHARTGLVIHPASLENLIAMYFPSFSGNKYDLKKMRLWWDSISAFLEPEVVNTAYIRLEDYVIENSMVAVPYLPEYLADALRQFMENPCKKNAEQLREIRDKIQEAVTMAKEIGDDNIPVTITGLAGLTAAITDNGLTINDYETPVTTGNALKAALTFMAEKKAEELTEAGLALVPEASMGAQGFVKPAKNCRVNFTGMPAANGIDCCLAETMLLGFEGTNCSFAKGIITIGQVRKIMELAEKYGFDPVGQGTNNEKGR